MAQTTTKGRPAPKTPVTRKRASATAHPATAIDRTAELSDELVR